jgi:Pyridoxal-dependent decarboxylase, pyridoxal binding domain
MASGAAVSIRRPVPYRPSICCNRCNGDLALLEVLAAAGACFDCASEAEIAAVLGCGVSADRIIFANACKRPSDIRCKLFYILSLLFCVFMHPSASMHPFCDLQERWDCSHLSFAYAGLQRHLVCTSPLPTASLSCTRLQPSTLQLRCVQRPHLIHCMSVCCLRSCAGFALLLTTMYFLTAGL